MHSIRQVDTGTVLDRAEANVVALRTVEFERLRIARDWALANRPDPAQLARNPLCARTVGSTEFLVLQHVEAELAAALQIHPLAALRLMGDAIDLNRRLPLTWDAAEGGRLPSWVARKIASLTSVLSTEQARRVDEQIAGLLGVLPPGRLLTVVEARVKEADPVLADQRAAAAAQPGESGWDATPRTGCVACSLVGPLLT